MSRSRTSKKPVHLSASEESGFFEVYGETFVLKDKLVQLGAKGFRDDSNVFKWRFVNKAYLSVVEFLNNAQKKGHIILGDVAEIDVDEEPEQGNSGGSDDEEQDTEPVPIRLASKSNATNGTTAKPAPIKTDLSGVNEHLATILGKLDFIQKAVGSKHLAGDDSKVKELTSTVSRLEDELTATEAALKEAQDGRTDVLAKVARFISLLESKGEVEFPASKLARELKKIQ